MKVNKYMAVPVYEIYRLTIEKYLWYDDNEEGWSNRKYMASVIDINYIIWRSKSLYRNMKQWKPETLLAVPWLEVAWPEKIIMYDVIMLKTICLRKCLMKICWNINLIWRHAACCGKISCWREISMRIALTAAAAAAGRRRGIGIRRRGDSLAAV